MNRASVAPLTIAVALLAAILAPLTTAHAQFQIFPVTKIWSYDTACHDNSDGWKEPGYDDSGWRSGPGGFSGGETNPLIIPILHTTTLPAPNTLSPFGHAMYFRTHFNMCSTSGVSLIMSNAIDDGATFYLNGTQILNLRVTTPGTCTSLSSVAIGPGSDAILWETHVFYPADLAGILVNGDNVLAVEVHQVNLISPDMVFGLVLMTASAGGPPPPPIQIQSTFDRDTDGWDVSGDADPPVFHASGGNPGGYLSVLDQPTGTYWYWVAPPKFLGNQSGFYGGLLVFDLEQDVSLQQNTDQPDIILTSDGLSLYFDTNPNPRTNWTSYTVPLNEFAGWRKGSLSGAAPTQVEMLRVLASLTDLKIRGEFSTLIETGGLDNVALWTSAPSPAAILKLRQLGPEQFAVEWPTLADGFRLQTATSLAPANWIDSAIQPSILNGLKTVALTPGMFYRLREPCGTGQ